MLSLAAPLALAAPVAQAAPAARAAAGQRASSASQAPRAMLPRVQPASGTPHFPVSTAPVEQIRQLVQCGNTMYAVGSFSVVEQNGQTFTRHNAFSFKATAPFTVTSWNPNVNGVVNSIAFNAGHCSQAYIGGNFTRVRGRTAVRIAEVRTTAPGALVSNFRHAANNQVETVASYQNHVLAGGFFTAINGSKASPYMVSLNPTSGRDDGFLRLGISGHYTYHGSAANGTRVFNQQISHGGRRELVEGDFTKVGGKRRHQIFMLNLASRPRATLTTWTSPRFDGSRGYPPKGYFYNCADREPFYIKSAAWSPDDRTVYLASTGFRPWNQKGFPLQGLCDSASAFSAGAAATFKWINYTGCDSLYSAAAGAGGVFFGGHERFSQNPHACDQQGTGAIPAPGMEAVNPATGLLITNAQGTSLYTRDRGIGADDLLLTRAGLWIASDNAEGAQMCDGVADLSGICFLPYS